MVLSFEISSSVADYAYRSQLKLHVPTSERHWTCVPIILGLSLCYVNTEPVNFYCLLTIPILEQKDILLIIYWQIPLKKALVASSLIARTLFCVGHKRKGKALSLEIDLNSSSHSNRPLDRTKPFKAIICQVFVLREKYKTISVLKRTFPGMKWFVLPAVPHTNKLVYHNVS